MTKLAPSGAALMLDGWARAQMRRGLSPGTIGTRGRYVRCLAEWLQRRCLTLATASRGDLERYLDDLQVCSKTCHGYISAFACFYRWALREGLMEGNPAVDIDRPKLPHYLPRPIPTDELGAAIELAEMPVRAFLLLAAYQGLRCKEIGDLRWPDVMDHLSPPMLLVSSGKGQKQRVLPLHPDVAECLRLASPRSEEGFVFVRPSGERWRADVVSKTVNDYLHNELGVASTAHSLRHFFGTSIYKATHDLLLCQSLLGHSNPATTSLYCQYDPAGGVAAILGLKAG